MADSSFPLHDAVRAGDTALLEQALAAGASNLNLKDKRGQTPLHLVVKAENPEMATMLMKAGADVSTKSNLGDTPMHVAAENDQHLMLKIMVEAGAPINLLDEDGWTPLHIASYFGCKAATITLLELGADVSAKTVKGIVGLANVTPLQLAGKFRGVPPPQQKEERNVLVAWMQSHASPEPAPPQITPDESAGQLYAEEGNKADPEDQEAVQKLHTMVQGWTPIHTACLLGNTREVRELLAQKADLHTKTSEGHSLLHVATAESKIGVMELLIAAGCPLNATMHFNMSTAAHCAVRKQRAQALSCLMKAGADLSVVDGKGETPLSLAARKDYWNLVQTCLQAADDCSSFINVPSGDGFTILHEACWRGRHELLELLVSKGADLKAQDAKGNSPLHAAAQSDQVEAIRMLLKLGAPVDQSKVGNGFTALHDAAYCGHKDAAMALVAGSADVQLQTKQMATALHLATEMNQIECIKGLVTAGTPVDVIDGAGWTPLHVACYHGCRGAAETLLQLGADPRVDVQRKKGKFTKMMTSSKTPLSLAGGLKSCDKETKRDIENLLRNWMQSPQKA